MLFKGKKAQSMIEYILLLMAVAGIMLVALTDHMPRILDAANIYYNRMVPGITGAAPRCGDGVCRPCPFESCGKCPADCGSCGGVPPC